MRFAASSLSFTGSPIANMAKLPKSFGIEIFYEWGSPDYWIDSLKLIMQGREGRLSIHSPFAYTDFASSDDEDRLFEVLRKPFDIYHLYDGEFYVVHTNGPFDYPANPVWDEELRKISMDRLYRFNEVCKREGVQMVVENLGFSRDKRTIFDQKQFVDIFRQMPHLKCLIDTGHALLADFDIYEVQEALSNNIIAYHVHDNDGQGDQHLRIGQGRIDWSEFVRGFQEFTPDATMVLEYNHGEVTDYINDAVLLSKFTGTK